jgi:hypothetical protein
MKSSNQEDVKGYYKNAWIIMFVLGILLSIDHLTYALIGFTPEIFEMDTGVPWAEFYGAYPTVATLVVVAERLSATGYLGMALFTTTVSFFGLRKGERWSWYALWIFPIVYGLGVAQMFQHEQIVFGLAYGVVTVLAVIGLLLPMRKIFLKDSTV